MAINGISLAEASKYLIDALKPKTTRQATLDEYYEL